MANQRPDEDAPRRSRRCRTTCRPRRRRSRTRRVEATVGRRRREGHRDRRRRRCARSRSTRASSIPTTSRRSKISWSPRSTRPMRQATRAAAGEAGRRDGRARPRALGSAGSAVCSAEARLALYEGPVQALIDELGRLPGVGPKSAQRIAFYLLKAAPEDAQRLAARDRRRQGTGRRGAGGASTSPKASCARSAATSGATRTSCASSRSRATSSRSNAPASSAAATTCCRVRSRRSRASGPSSCASRSCSRASATKAIDEVILATNPNIEGEATAMYLARLLKPLGMRVTRIASGLPVGGDLEYADEVTLGRALEGRREVDA